MPAALVPASSDEGYTFLVNLVLASPHNKPDTKPDDKDFNSTVKFQLVVGKHTYGNAAKAARTLVETSHSNCYLTQILNRKLETTTNSNVAVELIYGSGYRTYVKRNEGPEIKSYKQIGIYLSLGTGAEDEQIEKLPILMPDDNLWHHVMNMHDLYDGIIPTLYIRTSETLFIHPENAKNQSSISLNVPTKRGYWTDAVYEGKREKYPTELPKGVSTRKRKQPEEPKTTEGSNNKKAKDDTDDEASKEEKPKKKPSKKAKKTDESEEEKPKEAAAEEEAATKKSDDEDGEPKKKDKGGKRLSIGKKEKKKDESKSPGKKDDLDEDDAKAKKKSRRKSSGSKSKDGKGKQ